MTGVRLESLSQADWGNVVIKYKEKDHQFPYYIPTGEIFNLDPKSLIRLKCFALVGLTPLVAIARSVYWLATSIFTIFASIYHYLDGRDSFQRDVIYEKAYDSVRALGYGALMTRHAFMGIFTPYSERWRYGHLERQLNRHTDGPHRDKFYLAFCFQRLCILSKEDTNQTLVNSKLTKHLARIHAIIDAFWACNIRQLVMELQGVRRLANT